MPTIKVIASPENYKVNLDDNNVVVSVQCDYEGYRYVFTLNKEVHQRDINKLWSDRDEVPPTVNQYLVDCFAASFFGASRTYHINNIMNAFHLIEGVLTFNKIENNETEQKSL